ncbi:HD domain-containing protein 2 [Coccomyxa sp. Obi]|nr:HD domain-containing protein 2 [Coccomyxa sp. Obi]
MLRSGISAAKAVDFLHLLQNLKVTKRTGWIRCNVKGPESIADHMYRMGMMSLIAGDLGVNTDRCIRLSIVHDVAEAIVGDITPNDGISKEEKRRLEANAIVRIQEMLGPGSAAGEEIKELFEEYEEGQTPEALLVKDFDKLEMILQAQEYEKAQGLNLQEFFESTKGKFKTELGQSWAAEIVARRHAENQHSHES